MAVKKTKGIRTNHIQRQYDGRDIVPCRWIRNGGSKGIMVAQYKDTRDLVVDSKGAPITWNQA